MRTKELAAQTNQDSSAAFTLAELLVVIGVLAILVLTVLPALARTQPNSKAALCRHNLKQLSVAWQMYPEDNSGRIVPNFGAGYVPPLNGQAGWATGWLDWTTATANTNVLFLTTPRYAALSPYINGASNLFMCPADVYASPSQRTRGWTRRVRSYSVNAYVGENVPLGQAPGPNNDAMYRQIKKISEFFHPMPTEVAVFIDEHPDSMNDPIFWSPNQGNNWPDFPANYHDGAAVIAFADGHTEEHKWIGSMTSGQVFRVTYNSHNNYGVSPGDPDLSWMSYHTPRISSQSY